MDAVDINICIEIVSRYLKGKYIKGFKVRVSNSKRLSN